jgi:hypothetical protein
MRKYKSLIFHIIGSKKDVCIASNEIYQYTIENYFTSKIIQNNHLFRELDPYTTQNVYINECNNLKCEEIKRLNHSLNNRIPIISYAIYVNQPAFFCPYIDNVYSLDDTKHVKNKLLHRLLYTKYKYER